jgi:hypothetical protein
MGVSVFFQPTQQENIFQANSRMQKKEKGERRERKDRKSEKEYKDKARVRSR